MKYLSLSVFFTVVFDYNHLTNYHLAGSNATSAELLNTSSTARKDITINSKKYSLNQLIITSTIKQKLYVTTKCQHNF